MIRSKSMTTKPNPTETAAAAAVLKRSNTGDVIPPKKSSPGLIEFPVSPQLVVGEEMVHFGHPQHLLAKIDVPDLFTCWGCKEKGAGKRYVCQQCEFSLHDFCALAPPLLKHHPFHVHHILLFYSKHVKGGLMNTKCDVCGKAIKGFTFRCTACSFEMHPCCAMLTPQIKSPAHPHQLQLLPAATSASSASANSGETAGGFICGECKRGKRSGRVYRCTVCDYHLHAVCAKDLINGLRANGHKGKEKTTVLHAAGWLASQAVVEFLGGLMEGLGEGVGEVVLQAVTDRGTATRRVG